MKASILKKLQKADLREIKRASGIKHIQQRPQLFITKSGSVNQRVLNALNGCNFSENKIYPFMWGGSGNHISAKDYSFWVYETLNALGYKYTTGNDAPRGGKAGDYIKVSSAAMKAILEIKNS